MDKIRAIIYHGTGSEKSLGGIYYDGRLIGLHGSINTTPGMKYRPAGSDKEFSIEDWAPQSLDEIVLVRSRFKSASSGIVQIKNFPLHSLYCSDNIKIEVQ
jgi:hypothetical protein